MAGFGRREIEHMQALCIYNRYIESYSVVRPECLNGEPRTGIVANFHNFLENDKI